MSAPIPTATTAMKTRHIALVVFCVLAVVGLAWLFHTPAPEPAKPVAAAPAPKPIAAPKPAVSTTIAPPVAQPAQVSVTQAAAPAPAAPDTGGDPQKELNVAFDDIIGLLQGGNVYDAMMKYISPDDLDKMFAQAPPDVRANLQAQMQQEMSRPEAQQGIAMMVQVVQSMKTMTPDIDSTGNKATYHITDPSGQDTQSQPFSFKKVDGKWYVDPSSMGGF
jgi:hypothetical protein